MNCRLHNQQMDMVCARCADNMCPMCAEYINGAWFCPQCAIKERGIAAGLDYYDMMAASTGGPIYRDEAADLDVTES